MDTKRRLILLNGFASSGKTTIAKRYIDNHPLDLSVEGDHIIVMIGQWLKFEKESRELIFSLTKSMAKTHLENGRSVILPYLLTKHQHAVEFEEIANQYNADYYEIYLYLEKEEAINRLLKRGIWGEPGLPPLTEKDLPEINELYDTMVKETALRLNSITLHPLKDDIDHTYNEFLKEIGETK